MQLSQKVLGKSAAEAIASKAATPLLVIGKDVFFRRDLAGINCFNFLAASNLSALISSFGVKDTRDLFENVPPSAMVLPRLGTVSLATLGAAFEIKRLGGDQPLEAWMLRHTPGNGAKRELVCFSTMKHSEALREIGEVHARKHRKEIAAARRDKAQRIRGERYIDRANSKG